MFYKYGNLTWRLEIEWLIWGEGNVAAAFWSKKSAMNDNDLVVFNEFPPTCYMSLLVDVMSIELVRL
jgi:hypothetical protein